MDTTRRSFLGAFIGVAGAPVLLNGNERILTKDEARRIIDVTNHSRDGKTFYLEAGQGTEIRSTSNGPEEAWFKAPYGAVKPGDRVSIRYYGDVLFDGIVQSEHLTFDNGCRMYATSDIYQKDLYTILWRDPQSSKEIAKQVGNEVMKALKTTRPMLGGS